MANIVMIGSGNLATHLSKALHTAGHNIMQVYSPNIEHAEMLASQIDAFAISSLEDINNNAEIYIISIKDDAIKQVLTHLKQNTQDCILIHTAGSVPLSIFEGYTTHGAVLYPMQTFTKSRNLDFSTIPCFIEAMDEKSMMMVRLLASSVAKKVVELDSEKRRSLHLAAVFACNMVNHCYRLAEKVTEKAGLDFSLFHPLIAETALKAQSMSPKMAQTGPMVRGDETIMSAQKTLIENDTTRRLYEIMAESIYNEHNK